MAAWLLPHLLPLRLLVLILLALPRLPRLLQERLLLPVLIRLPRRLRPLLRLPVALAPRRALPRLIPSSDASLKLFITPKFLDIFTRFSHPI